MPIHDWAKVRANRFHHFHQTWTPLLAAELNAGVLPPNYLALTEQITGGPEPDVVALSMPSQTASGMQGGVAIEEALPKVRVTTQSDSEIYARKANRISISHPDGTLVAVIEIVSPGNKDSQHAIRSFARKAVEFLHQGIHLLIVDLFPPTKRDPQGIHKLIWDRIRDEPFDLPPDKPFTLVSYSAGALITGYVENVAAGDVLPDMPIFLTPTRYVLCPLERTYQQSWQMFPKALREPLEREATS